MASEVNPLHLIYEKKDKKNPKNKKYPNNIFLKWLLWLNMAS